MDEKKLMQAIGIVGELQTSLLARYWNADKVFESVSYKLAKQTYFKEMKALERLDRAIRYTLLDNKQLTWDEYNNLVFHDNPCLLIRDIELCVVFTRLCKAGVAKHSHSLKEIVDTKIQNEASRSVSSQSETSCGESKSPIRKWALEMLREIEEREAKERRVTKLRSREAELLIEPIRYRY